MPGLAVEGSKAGGERKQDPFRKVSNDKVKSVGKRRKEKQGENKCKRT